MSSIMELIRPELSELSALELENLPYLTSRMSSIMGQIEPEHPELFALEFGKIAEYDFVYTVSFTNINRGPAWLSGKVFDS